MSSTSVRSSHLCSREVLFFLTSWPQCREYRDSLSQPYLAVVSSPGGLLDDHKILFTCVKLHTSHLSQSVESLTLAVQRLSCIRSHNIYVCCKLNPFSWSGGGFPLPSFSLIGAQLQGRMELGTRKSPSLDLPSGKYLLFSCSLRSIM